MDLRIRSFAESDLTDVVRLYNGSVDDIPYNWSVTEEEFYDEIIGKGRLSNPDFPFHPDNLLIASVNGKAEGFAHLSSTKDGKSGLIRFLTFPRDKRSIGEALLEAAIDRLRRMGHKHVEAWQMESGYPFYTSQHGGCWEQSHITNLFLADGFENYHREVVLHRTLDFGTDPLPLPEGKRFEKTQQTYGNDMLCLIRIMDGDTEAASCSWHRMSAVSRHMEAKHYGYIHGIGTSPSYRREGLGRIMMQEMLHDMGETGLKETLLHTMFDNIPAIGLYTKTGFRYIGTSIILRKDIA